MIAVFQAISNWMLSVFNLLASTNFANGISYLDLFIFLIILNMLIGFMKSMLMTFGSDAKRTILKGGTKTQKTLKPMKSLDRSENK